MSKGSTAPGTAGIRRRGTPEEEAAAEGRPQQGATGDVPPSSPGAVHRARRRAYRHRQRPYVRTTRLSAGELARITAGAEAAGLTLSGFLARSALSAARDLDRTAASLAGRRELVAELFAARRHLGQVGNNLNQVARAINSGATPKELDVVLAAVHRAVARIQDATDRLLDRN
ncbi:plasmid mobilization relaxosome protein MobC [Streptomyces sp. RFCAC02]|uniref:plasmid mobilization protein n=1 Tax=Streptomyces sp. RFCAC02 TaxID=2499143 RepID=UPI001F10B7C0|nr:plasmid mobilization relaxosome protein MobC [Streptomyces sp. RFCAC02]